MVMDVIGGIKIYAIPDKQSIGERGSLNEASFLGILKANLFEPNFHLVTVELLGQEPLVH